MLKYNDLSNKTVLITGATRGIGKTILKLFSASGCCIYACARKKSKDFENNLEDLSTKHNVSITPLYFDLNNDVEIKNVFLGLIKNKIKIDILINNAGISHGGLFQMTSSKTLKEVFQVNFFSQVMVTQYVIKLMIKQKIKGTIVNISSIAGIDGYPGYIAYGSSKAALNYMTKTLVDELSPHGIRINSVAPGLTETEMASEMESKAKNTMINNSALKRLATSSEIAKVVIFLSSNESSFVNGQILRIDGGKSFI
jgi:3-oxoacyl-[acyl-carrier protein] reductase